MRTFICRLWSAAVVVAFIAAGAAAPGARAAFSLGPCAGAPVAGQGSSFQKAAQGAWAAQFAAACSIAVGYTPNGSGTGLAAMGAGAAGERDAATRFAGTDDAPTADQIARIDAGPASGATGAGRVRTIPVAAGAIVLIVNFPDGCAVPADARYGDRFHVSNSVLEQAWAGERATWGELLPGIASPCADAPVKRAVRFDVSGTTQQFKRWLDHVNPRRGWSAYGNTEWPGNTINAGAKGGGPLAALVASTDGSLGYVDLATARAAGFEAGDDTFWLPVDDTAGNPVEPTADPQGFVHGTAARGAACETTQFTGVPGGSDPTLGDWSAVTGVETPTGYPLCLLTYALAWDDDAPVYGATAAEEAKARTVKDYLALVTGSDGQGVLAAHDYAPLPAALAASAQAAVDRIDWNR